MVLVDTSIWIRFLANREPYAEELNRLLSLDEVVGHQFVYGELLIGDRGGRQKLLAEYGRMDQAKVVPHREVVAFVLNRRLHGLGAGWIDVHLLASVIVEGLNLWTADPRLSALAEQLGVAYHPPAHIGPTTAS
jgi:predicted nucleic acid-binding protein